MGAGGKAVLAICNFIDTKEKVVRGFQSTEGSRDIAHLISEGAASGVRLEEGHRAQGLLGRRPEETAESSTASQIQQRGISIKKKKKFSIFLPSHDKDYLHLVKCLFYYNCFL